MENLRKKLMELTPYHPLTTVKKIINGHLITLIFIVMIFRVFLNRSHHVHVVGRRNSKFQAVINLQIALPASSLWGLDCCLMPALVVDCHIHSEK